MESVMNQFFGEVANFFGEEKNSEFKNENNSLSIEVMYHNPNLIPINFQENGDWIDLRAAEEYHLYHDRFYLINIRISIKITK